MTLNERIERIPHDGWWHDHNCETFQDLGARLVAKGLTEDEALNILSTAFFAASDEFGA
jgi:hypothetical protein